MVGARVGLGALPLLRGHVHRRPEEGAGAGEIEVERELSWGRRAGVGVGVLARLRGAAQLDERLAAGADAGEAEVHHAHPAVVADHHVLGLEVAVDEAGAVGRREPAADVEEEADDRLGGPRRRPAPARQGHPLDELHGDEDLAVDRADVVDRDDVGVGELGHRLGLAQEAGAPGLVLAARLEELERDL
ncbi:MAG: hypothetical protein KC486_22485, partial [Myxococcales bacterium]|nr:hypothetical protein [Myxococcales bacterium]